MDLDHWLFAYGTLGDPAIQVATFGHLLESHLDTLPAFTKVLLEITDPDVLRTSGQTHHPIIRATDDSLRLGTRPGPVLDGSGPDRS